MISPEQIKKQALAWWPEVLQAGVRGESCFPRSITRIGKISGSDVLDHYGKLQEELAALSLHAKTERLAGYLIHYKQYHFQKAGDHLLPDYIEFETLEDYLVFTGKAKAWRTFNEHLSLILKTIPTLKDWVTDNAEKLTAGETPWVDILQVCLYFMDNPRPDLYIRQLPLEVHTKFIEQHGSLLISLLDFLIPGDIRDSKERKRIDRRYYLRYDEPLIRIRVLDAAVETGLDRGRFRGQADRLPDFSLPVSDFTVLDLPVTTVFIAENKMNFLTLPALPGSIGIWSGGGFQVSTLRAAEWLARRRIIYWGDLDEHGFQILHQIRSYFPQTQSVMMDRQTLLDFDAYRVAGARSNAASLSLLTQEEQATYELLRASSLNRLEQEKIDQRYAEARLRALL